MLTHLVAIVGLAALCGLWVVVQRAGRRPDEDSGGGCGACGCHGAAGQCQRKAKAAERT